VMNEWYRKFFVYLVSNLACQLIMQLSSVPRMTQL
jgi:hypothetical protein